MERIYLCTVYVCTRANMKPQLFVSGQTIYTYNVGADNLGAASQTLTEATGNRFDDSPFIWCTADSSNVRGSLIVCCLLSLFPVCAAPGAPPVG